MEHRKQVTNPGGVERRYMADGLEYRNSDTGAPSLRGYALRFGSVYNMGWFTEEVDKRALDGADLSDVRILLNHDSNQILGRTSAGTARVGVDGIGMWYEVDLPTSPNGENVRVAVERGDITQSSWGFSLSDGGDRWEMRDGVKHRTLAKVSMVFDASPVTYPANPDTTVAKRSAEQFEQEQTPKVDTELQRDIETQIEIALMERRFSFSNLKHA